MRRLIIGALLLCLWDPGTAGQLSGVTLPDSVTVEGSSLVLNGMGQRKKAWIEVYVAGLYLPERSSDPSLVLQTSPWRLVMQFVYKKVDKAKLDEAFSDGFKNNTPEILSSHQADVERFLACFPDMRKGDVAVLTYFPERGLSVEVNGEEKGVFGSEAFARAVLAIWLGPKPPSDDLKKGLLGIS